MQLVRRVLAQAAREPLARLDKARMAAGLFAGGRLVHTDGPGHWWVPAMAAAAAVALVVAIALRPAEPDVTRPAVPPTADGERPRVARPAPAPVMRPRAPALPAARESTSGHVEVAFSRDADVRRRALRDGGQEVILERGGCYTLLAPPLAGRYLVRTPAGSVEATGTVFVVQVLGPGRTGVWLFEGSLRLRPRQAGPFAVQAPVAVLLGPRGIRRGKEPPTSRTAADELARIRGWLAAREIDQARRALDAYLQRRPNDRRAVFLLADAHRLEGRTEEAIELYLRVAERRGAPDGSPAAPREEPSSGPQAARLAEAALYQAGRLQRERLDRPADALAAFERALREHPNGLLRQEILYQLAACRLAMGKFEQAVDAFEGYLRAYPQGTKAEEARTLLRALREKGWR